jgi:hypothetical protein
VKTKWLILIIFLSFSFGFSNTYADTKTEQRKQLIEKWISFKYTECYASETADGIMRPVFEKGLNTFLESAECKEGATQKCIDKFDSTYGERFALEMKRAGCVINPDYTQYLKEKSNKPDADDKPASYKECKPSKDPMRRSKSLLGQCAQKVSCSKSFDFGDTKEYPAGDYYFFANEDSRADCPTDFRKAEMITNTQKLKYFGLKAAGSPEKIEHFSAGDGAK